MSGLSVQNNTTDHTEDSAAAVFRNVTFSYPGETVTLIENLDFTVRRGEFVALIGPSGCGKSTIFRLLNRLNDPVAGEVEIVEESTEPSSEKGAAFSEKNRVETSPSPSALPRAAAVRREAKKSLRRPFDKGNARCGYMPQQDMLFPWRTVSENIRLPLELRGGMSEAEMKERAAKALREVGLDGWGDKLPRELSGGMRQRASFARTLMTGADLLLLDEPFSALDYLTRLSMREWLLEQWERDKKTVLFITHDVEEAIFLSTRILAVEQSPIRSLREYTVPLPYPRTESALAVPEALALKEKLIRLFRNAGNRTEKETDE